MKADTRKAVEEALDKLGDLIDQLASNAREFDYDTANRMERDAAKALITISEALLRSEGDGWEPISELNPHERIIVRGWQPPIARVAGYWWWHEDVADQNGKPMNHPSATQFRRIDLPPPPAKEESNTLSDKLKEQ